jgi:NTP pyrophosphatase (non-canonical NTP hydrolase)
MDQQTYRDAITRTWNDDPPTAYQPANAALGVVGEVHEYADSPTVDELGDLLHYATTLRRLYDFPVADPAGETLVPDLERMRRLAGAIAERTKKCVYHGDEPGEELETLTSELLDHVAAEAEVRLETTLEAVRQENVDKLYERYPNGFEAAGGGPADTPGGEPAG